MIPAVITTKHRGVFFGHLKNGVPETLGEGDSLAVSGIRMCVYWSKGMRGVLGLASKGPDASCRITAKVSGETRLYGVTAVFPASETAARKWEEAPWS